MESKITHLQIIQGIINRMSGHSFLLKGWTVTLVAALLALGGKEENYFYIYIAFFPPVMFWLLDGFYLHVERQFKELYEEVRLKRPEEIDFSLDRNHIDSENATWLSSIFSKSLAIFYGGILFLIAVVFVFLL